MDFFEAQDRARKATWKLVGLYLLAVAMIIISVYVVILLLFRFAGFLPYDATIGDLFWQPVLLGYVAVILLIVIATGTIFRIFQLRKGGSAVAEMLGGRRVDPSTRDPKERQLMNVVEEMAIASGLPVPDVYILDREESINAFAAGFGTADAAVGVTRGTLEKLSRNELQGVIAHEFSHIFNGDMRLNIRLIGILNGILLLHIMGMIIMRSGAYSSLGGGRSGGRGGGGAATLVIILLGLALIIIGYIGMLFGRMIQAAISRQREYLADAAAVQYTRNPDGIAGALRKIDRSMDGGKIEDGHAMEMSHLFFASSFHTFLDRLYATHPPIAERIRAIDPSGAGAEDRRKQEQIRKRLEQDRIARAKADGKRISGARTGAGALEDFFGRTEGAPGTAGSGGGGTAAGGSAAGALGAAHPALRPEVILAAIGTLDGDQVSRAGKLLAGIPPSLREAAHEPFGAEALVIALLLATRTEETGIPAWLRDKMDPKMAGYAEKLLDELRGGDRQWYLPLTELALPALRHMSEQQYRDFRATIQALILEDKQVSLFEFVLEKLVARQLDAAFSPIAEPKIRHYHLKTLANEFSVVLSAMAHASGSDTRQAWDAGTAAISDVLPGGVTLLDAADCAPAQLDPALDEIAASATPVKKYILTALLHSITVDEHVSVEERELLRAIFETIDIPIPLDVL
jgi:Zn-dependent protease with chaperone function